MGRLNFKTIHMKEFTLVPSHLNYQNVADGGCNLYNEFEHEPKSGLCTTTLLFLEHIFGNETIIGMDYLQLLYQQPAQRLPSLCLVGRDWGTGKTTFSKWLKALFSSNMVEMNDDISRSDFNSEWATKLIVCFDAIPADKKLLEKIKSLSTRYTLTMYTKGRDPIEIDFFAKFIFATQNEEAFLCADGDEVRWWIRNLPPICEADRNITLLEEMIEEIPAFLYYLNTRKMYTKKAGPEWFGRSYPFDHKNVTA